MTQKASICYWSDRTVCEPELTWYTNASMNARTIVTTYLMAQAFGTAAWWCALFIVPASIRWFQPESWPDDALLGFWLADGLLVVGGSLASALMVLKRLPYSGIAIWMLAATTWYPTLYCIGVSTLTGEAWLASGLGKTTRVTESL